MPLWRYLRGGGKRAMAVWHRRAGKDDVCLHHTAISAFERQGNYWHMLPEYAQARKAIWDAVNPHTGIRRIDEAFPAELRASTRDHDMHIRFHNGSTWACIGSDEYDRTVGSSAAGVVFSEYALSNPSAWGYLRPMLEENGGWATFITTPRGRNHAHAMYNYAAQEPGWFAERLTVDDTGALTQEQLDETQREYRALYGSDFGRAQFLQEYYCDWSASILGAFYSVECAQLRDEGRVLPVGPLPGQYVHRAWDLGVSDDTSIWWFCAVGAQLFVLDHYASSGVGLEHYLNEIEKREHEHGWRRGVDLVPHDAKVKEWGSGRTRVETMQSMGLKPQLVPMAGVEDGRNAVRRTLPLCVFHPRTDETGLSALEQNRREWDDEKKAFKASDVHDWTSHPADAFRYLALGWKLAPLREVKVEQSYGIVIPPPVDDNRKGIRL